jgi:hypothetical protein
MGELAPNMKDRNQFSNIRLRSAHFALIMFFSPTSGVRLKELVTLQTLNRTESPP